MKMDSRVDEIRRRFGFWQHPEGTWRTTGFCRQSMQKKRNTQHIHMDTLDKEGGVGT